jgi:hypothetical protein
MVYASYLICRIFLLLVEFGIWKEMKYMKEYKLTEHGAVTIYVRCQKPNLKREADDKFCVHCASPVLNECTNQPIGNEFGDFCGAVMTPYVCYCSKCGSPTTFYQAGLVDTEYPKTELIERTEPVNITNLHDEDLPF